MLSGIPASSSPGEVTGAGTLCEGPCAGGSSGWAGCKAGSVRGRGMMSIASPCHTPPLHPCPHVPSSAGGRMALRTLCPLQNCSPHQCLCRCSPSIPRNPPHLPGWNSAGGSRGSHRSGRAAVARAWGSNGSHCHQRPLRWMGVPAWYLHPHAKDVSSGTTSTHPFSSASSRPTGHRHWLVSQELCR